MSDIILVCPPGSTSERLYTMSEAGGIASVLKDQQFSVDIIDCNYWGRQFEEIVKCVVESSPMIITFIFQWERDPFRNWTQELIEQLQRIRQPALHNNAIGRGATVCHKSILTSYDFFDSVICGESELTFPELAQKIKANQDWAGQKGIAYKKEHDVIRNQNQCPLSDLDALPFADRNYLKDRKMYPVASMHSSRYCYGLCNFCVNKVHRNATPGEHYRARSATLVVDEMQMIHEKYGVKTFCFVDNNFFVDGIIGKKRAIDIAQQLIERKLKLRFHVESRVNDVDAELFALLKKAGLRKVFLGLESGSQSVLDRFCKETTVEMNKKAMQVLRDLRISFEPGFIMFDPLITFDELKENVAFVKETELYKCKCSTGSPLFSTLSVYCGSSVEAEIPNELWLSEKYENGIRSYRFQDDKVQVVYNMIRLFQHELIQHLHQKQQKLQKLSTEYNSMNDEDKTCFINDQKKINQMQNDCDLLALTVLDEIINYIDKINVVDNSHITDIKKMISDRLLEVVS